MPTIEFHGDRICSGCGAILKPQPQERLSDPEFAPHTDPECIRALREATRQLNLAIRELREDTAYRHRELAARIRELENPWWRFWR